MFVTRYMLRLSCVLAPLILLPDIVFRHQVTPLLLSMPVVSAVVLVPAKGRPVEVEYTRGVVLLRCHAYRYARFLDQITLQMICRCFRSNGDLQDMVMQSCVCPVLQAHCTLIHSSTIYVIRIRFQAMICGICVMCRFQYIPSH